MAPHPAAWCPAAHLQDRAVPGLRAQFSHGCLSFGMCVRRRECSWLPGGCAGVRVGGGTPHPGHLRNRQHPRGPRLLRTAWHVPAQGPDALPARPRRASNERAHRSPDADHDHPPSAAPSRCQPLNPSTCRHRTHSGERSPTYSETERSFSRCRWSSAGRRRPRLSQVTLGCLRCSFRSFGLRRGCVILSGVYDAPEAMSPHVTCVYPLVAALLSSKSRP